jgi:hypothetical protein
MTYEHRLKTYIRTLTMNTAKKLKNDFQQLTHPTIFNLNISVELYIDSVY